MNNNNNNYIYIYIYTSPIIIFINYDVIKYIYTNNNNDK